ncbi:MAG TPA: hypothetical protein EYQ64_12840 [Gemmatimonadetes bacterium]|nr:hypothetical protein [Gemmatimonadota bacterium]
MSPAATSAAKEKALIEGSIKLVGHHVGEGADGGLHVETTITCQGRTFSGASSGPAVLPDRLKPSALATIRALGACLEDSGVVAASRRALLLDDVIEVSVGDVPVAVVMITASEKSKSTPVVAAYPLVGMSDLAIIVATLQATTRIVSHWIAGGHRSAPAEKQERPQ